MLQQLDSFEKTWGEKYLEIIKSWQDNGDNVATLFRYPPHIRKAIYTINAIESPNSVIRKATKQRKVFPTNQSAMKVVYLAISATFVDTVPAKPLGEAANPSMQEDNASCAKADNLVGRF